MKNDSRTECTHCKIYKREMRLKNKGKLTCCKWFIDNVVCGNKSISDCTEKKV